MKRFLFIESKEQRTKEERQEMIKFLKEKNYHDKTLKRKTYKHIPEYLEHNYLFDTLPAYVSNINLCHNASNTWRKFTRYMKENDISCSCCGINTYDAELKLISKNKLIVEYTNKSNYEYHEVWKVCKHKKRLKLLNVICLCKKCHEIFHLPKSYAVRVFRTLEKNYYPIEFWYEDTFYYNCNIDHLEIEYYIESLLKRKLDNDVDFLNKNYCKGEWKIDIKCNIPFYDEFISELKNNNMLYKE